jgi:hypothetical protein
MLTDDSEPLQRNPFAGVLEALLKYTKDPVCLILIPLDYGRV